MAVNASRRSVQLAFAAFSILLMCRFQLQAEPQTRALPEGKRTARLGVLGYSVDPLLVEVFRARMRELGYVEGKDIEFVFRTSGPGVESLPAEAGALKALDVDLILAVGSPSVRAAMKATANIPIVMIGIGHDPVRLGFVKSLARPGGNVTGVAALGLDLWPKRLQLLRQAVPNISQIAVLTNSTNATNAILAGELERIVAAAGLKAWFHSAAADDQLERTLSEVRRQHPQALICAWDNFLVSRARRIGQFSIESRIPVLAAVREYVQAGALMSYGAKLPDQWRRAANYADRILKGAKTTELPVEQPMEFELVLNGKSARALGVAIPPELLLQADQVLE